MKQREPRHKVLIPVRMRWDGRWVAASVRNVSSRGMLLFTAAPPRPGTFVEIQLSSGPVAAQSIWTMDHFCGVRSQGRLDVAALSGGRTGQADVRTSAVSASLQQSRRPSAASVREKAERSQRFAAMVQFATVVVVGVCAAVSLGWEVYNILSVPMTAIQSRMP